MKKLLRYTVPYIIVICMFMTACNTTYSFNCQQPTENIVRVILVDEFGEMEIPEDKYHILLSEIKKLPWRKYWNDPEVVLSEPYITIDYENGCYEEISASASYYHTAEGSELSWKYFDRDKFSEVLEKIAGQGTELQDRGTQDRGRFSVLMRKVRIIR